MEFHSTKEALEAENKKGEEAMHENMQETCKKTPEESHEIACDRSRVNADRSRSCDPAPPPRSPPRAAAPPCAAVPPPPIAPPYAAASHAPPSPASSSSLPSLSMESSCDSNKGDKKPLRNLETLKRTRRKQRKEFVKELKAIQNLFNSRVTNQVEVEKSSMKPNDSSSCNVSGSSSYVIPQKRQAMVMMIQEGKKVKEDHEVSQEISTPFTKIAYINGDKQFIVGSNDRIDTPHEIDLFSKKLKVLIEKDNGIKKFNREGDSSFQGIPCEDPGHFTLGVRIGNNIRVESFLDATSNINYMSKATYDKLKFPPLKIVPLPNQKVIGVVENIPIKINDLSYTINFIILNIPSNPFNEIVLGRPFLATSLAILDMREGSITLHQGKEVRKMAMIWNLNNHSCPIPYEGSYLEDLRIIKEK